MTYWYLILNDISRVSESLSFIYAREGQADDEGIPEKGIFSADMLILEVFRNLV